MTKVWRAVSGIRCKAEIGATLPGVLMFVLLLTDPAFGWIMATFMGGSITGSLYYFLEGARRVKQRDDRGSAVEP